MEGRTSTASGSRSTLARRESSRWTPTGRTIPSTCQHWSARCRAAPGAPDGSDLVIGSRYVKGGGVRNWSLARRAISRGGSLFARTVLSLRQRDLTGGFKAWRAEVLDALPWERLHSGGYVSQIETTYLASRAGATVTEIPIVFVDRVLGASKMSRRIIVEALVVVLQLRWDALRGRIPKQTQAADKQG